MFLILNFVIVCLEIEHASSHHHHLQDCVYDEALGSFFTNAGSSETATKGGRIKVDKLRARVRLEFYDPLFSYHYSV